MCHHRGEAGGPELGSSSPRYHSGGYAGGQPLLKNSAPQFHRRIYPGPLYLGGGDTVPAKKL